MGEAVVGLSTATKKAADRNEREMTRQFFRPPLDGEHPTHWEWPTASVPFPVRTNYELFTSIRFACIDSLFGN